MILCIDVGNSLIHFGVFNNDELVLQFRYNSKEGSSSDQLGIFILNILSVNKINSIDIKHIVIASVVPEIDYSIRASCIKYFKIDPFFLNIGAKSGLKIKYSSPAEVGADRIATAIGAVHLYPKRDLMIIDMGTATTVCAVTQDKEYLGGAILAGIKTSIKALHSNTSKLASVEIVKPKDGIGRTTKENIQIGLFYGHIGSVKEIIKYLAHHAFAQKPYLIIGTGSFSELFKNENLFDIVITDLTLQGLNRLHYLNDICPISERNETSKK